MLFRSNNIPKRDGYTFLGWFDKVRENKQATILQGGDTATFIYEESTDPYTFDALWANLKADDVTYPYDGNGHTIENAIQQYNGGNLNQQYIDEIDDANLVEYGDILYSRSPNSGYSAVKPTFTDVGKYSIYVKTIIKVDGRTVELKTQATVTITPVKLSITITGNHNQKQYNGKEQKVIGFTTDAPDAVSVSLKSGRAAVASGVSVGKYYMGLSEDDFSVTSSNSNYSDIEVTIVDGYLDITPITEKLIVTVTGNHNTLTYNGSEQSVNGYTSDAPTGVNVTLAEGSEAVAKGTNAGRYMMGLEADDFVASSTNYSNIEVKVVDGYLDITPVTETLTVTVTGNTASRVYTGSEQSVKGYTSDAPDTVGVRLVTGSVAEAVGTDAGRYYMGLTKNNFKVSSANYSSIEVKVVDGYLDITPVTETLTVTVTGNTASRVYTGIEQGVDGYTSDAPTGVNVTLAEGSEAVAKGTNAGRYMMGLEADDFVASSTNYSSIEVKVEIGREHV